MMLASLAVLSLALTLGSADYVDISWPSNADKPFDPITWWESVTYTTCNSTTPCAAGFVCNNYPPCKQSWCDTCVDPYLSVVTFSGGKYSFTCVLPTKKLGESCTKDTDCYDDASTCTSATCQCPAGMTATSNNTACTSSGYVQLGATCTSSYQCGNNAQCGNTRTSGTCQCYDNYVTADSTNCVGFKVDTACTSDNCPSDAVCPGASCSTGKYACNTGYKWVNTTQTGALCVFQNATLDVTSGNSCSDSQICAYGLACYQCPENSAYTCESSVPVPVTITVSTTTPSGVSNTSGTTVICACSVTSALLLAILLLLA